MLVQPHMRARLLAVFFTGCVLLEVTGRKGECTHAWAPRPPTKVTLETARRSCSWVGFCFLFTISLGVCVGGGGAGGCTEGSRNTFIEHLLCAQRCRIPEDE